MQPETPITPNPLPPYEPAPATPAVAPTRSNKKSFIIVSIVVVVVLIAIAVLILNTSPSSSNEQKQLKNNESNTALTDNVQTQLDDENRRIDILLISSQLESYFAESNGYPSLADLNDPTWRAANDVNLKKLTRTIDLSATAPISSEDAYSYDNLSPTGCISPTNDQGAPNTGTVCESYRLTAVLEGDGSKYIKSSVD